MKDISILIADDERDILDLLEYNLEAEGYRITKAANGLEVLEKVKHFTPDVILLDISMPELDGIETCYRLRENDALIDTYIIFLTARIEEYVEVAAFEAGGNDF
ncbi:MAG: response regulator [Bacteroidota bacterium]